MNPTGIEPAPRVYVGLLASGRHVLAGGSGPQPHPIFIEVFCGAALGGRNRTVARSGEDRDTALVELSSKAAVASARADAAI